MKVALLLIALVCVAHAWTNTPTMIIARIAIKDMEQNGRTLHNLQSFIY